MILTSIVLVGLLIWLLIPTIERINESVKNDKY
jgi:hypothetical protein